MGKTIEIEKEDVKRLVWSFHSDIGYFTPADEFADGATRESPTNYDENVGYALGMATAAQDTLSFLTMMVGDEYDLREMAEEYAEEQGLDTFEDEEFWAGI